jgi:hypothetical protein
VNREQVLQRILDEVAHQNDLLVMAKETICDMQYEFRLSLFAWLEEQLRLEIQKRPKPHVEPRKIGRPRTYGDETRRTVANMILDGATHRTIAKWLDIPPASISNIAKLSGAKRPGNLQGGPRTRGTINVQRKHVAITRSTKED